MKEPLTPPNAGPLSPHEIRPFVAGTAEGKDPNVDDELFERCYQLADRWGVSRDDREECARFIARAVGLAVCVADAGKADVATSMQFIEDFKKRSA